MDFLSFRPNHCSRLSTADSSAASIPANASKLLPTAALLQAAPSELLPTAVCHGLMARSISIPRAPSAAPTQQVVHADEVEPECPSALPLGQHDIRAVIIFPDPDDRRRTRGSSHGTDSGRHRVRDDARNASPPQAPPPVSRVGRIVSSPLSLSVHRRVSFSFSDSLHARSRRSDVTWEILSQI